MRIPPSPPPPDRPPPADAADEFARLFADPAFQALVARVNREHRPWEKVRYIARGAGFQPEAVWLAATLFRRLGARPLPFTDINGKGLTYTLPDPVSEELMRIDQELAGHLRIDHHEPMTERMREAMIVRSLMEEAITSSQIEGASTVHRVAKDMLRRGRAPRDRGEQMIANNYQAICFLRDHLSTPLTPEFVIDLQRMLTERTLDDPSQCGRLRRADENVRIEDAYGSVMHTPPPASSMPERLDRLCSFANQQSGPGGTFLHPVIRAVTLHFQLAYDHPFADGNGRTARALFYWSMLRSGYWLFEFLPISRLILQGRAKYAMAFQHVEVDSFDLTYFLVYHAKLFSRARRELREHLRRKLTEQSEARRRFDDDSLNTRQRLAIARLTDARNTATTIEDHQAAHGVSYFTARADLLALEELGYLTRERVDRRFVFRPGPRLLDHAP